MRQSRRWILASAVLGLGAVLAAGSVATAKPPQPPPPPVPVTWTAEVQTWSGGQWDGAVAAAAAHVEEVNGVVHDDWRLPTVEEVQAAIQSGAWGTIPGFSGEFRHWTSKSQGQWAWAVRITVDTAGVPITSQSGESQKVLKTSRFHSVRFVRP